MSWTTTTFNIDLRTAYDGLARLDEHTPPANETDQHDHRRGKCYTLAQVIEAAPAEIRGTDGDHIRANLGQSQVFITLAFDALTTGF